ncbi:cell division protein FtsI [Paenibacillus sp. FSL R7-0273]|uniref:peptidoglycan D,D-transpeptidase FtsI family protein n=1 Tax=Paenibacillus sp. FSL R7-0273 TaxID=1536772 RepID=UPI0004F7716F|nr:penicillin-binding transpeptidase domain-containing protein [Paenibacillus sp. FSL R7-0273]AIQ49200.1 cell division protein FtsI [Paenibacillus sp. FSL R7-0273]OMF87776.1 cell division protein FtsI [Paenibacillus sp. FSL R7-0273]
MSFFRKQASPPEKETTKSSLGLRINVFFFSTFVIFCVIIIRLAVVQFVEGPMLTEVETSRDTKNVPLAAIRGVIRAAGGEELAYSTSVQSLYITLTKEYTAKATDKITGETALTPEAKAKGEALAARLVADFKQYGDPAAVQLTEEDIISSLDLYFKKYSGFMARRIKAGLTSQEVAYFMEHKSEYPGLEIVEESSRHYDKDTVAVQTIGYIKPFKSSSSLDIYKNIQAAMKKIDADPGLSYKDDEFVGFDGLELQYQRELRGKNGYQVISVNPQNMAEKVEEVVPPVKGNDVWTTINKTIQMKTEQAITDQIDWLHSHAVQGKTHPDALTGYAVAMEVDTGNIVAMASMPDYDTNVWTADKMDTKVWNEIMGNYQNGTITPYSSGMSGHEFGSTVLLGSTIKPLSVLIGLNEGFFTTSTIYQDRGIAYFGKNDNASVRNASGHVYGSMDPARAIEKSSNAFMVDMIGKKLWEKYQNKGIEVWDQYMKEFGLGVSTQSGLPREFLGQINYTDTKAAGSAQAALVYASFGQQGRYTVLQLAQYTSTLANEGVRIKPQLVSKITDSEGNVVKQFQREVLDEVTTFDKAHWREVIKGMKSEVSAFSDFAYDFARKTGTSQQTDRTNTNRDNGVFIAFAPRENPKLAVAVVIPEGGFGSNSAAPVARKIFDAYDWEYGLDGVPKKTQQAADGAASAADGAETDGATD